MSYPFVSLIYNMVSNFYCILPYIVYNILIVFYFAIYKNAKKNDDLIINFMANDLKFFLIIKKYEICINSVKFEFVKFWFCNKWKPNIFTNFNYL